MPILMASVDKVVYTFSQKQDILQLLEEHITENIVKVRHHFINHTTILMFCVDWARLLPPGCGHTTRISTICAVMFFLLRRSGKKVLQV